MTDEEKALLVQDGLATVPQGQKFIGSSRSNMYKLMDDGRLPYVKIGRSRRIPWRALIDLAASNVLGGWRTDDQ